VRQESNIGLPGYLFDEASAGGALRFWLGSLP
jgi:hypothetical protein